MLTYSTVLFCYSFFMFPGVYWFACKKTFETMYVVGKYTPLLLKKIINRKNNALDSTTGEGNPEDEDSIQHTKLS